MILLSGAGYNAQNFLQKNKNIFSTEHSKYFPRVSCTVKGGKGRLLNTKFQSKMNETAVQLDSGAYGVSITSDECRRTISLRERDRNFLMNSEYAERKRELTVPQLAASLDPQRTRRY